jgi:sensor c-di-GMP phosphodiesterase-like protein
MNITKITEGLDRGEFLVVYLPTIDLTTGRCIGAEALTRWQRGLEVINPFGFEGLHRNVSLCGRITYWVIETVGAELRDWLRDNDAHIAINIPPAVIGRGGIIHAVRTAGLSDLAAKVVFELTESGHLDEVAVAAVEQARETGARLALDDATFSRADASLLLFSRMPVDIVKLPKSFTDGLLSESGEAMRALEVLLNATGAKVIAEGVETEEQAEALKQVGVQMAQGYYFSRPLPVKEFLAFFESRR